MTIKNIKRSPINKRVIDGVYETNKMLLNVGKTTVTKLFKPHKSSSARRYKLEKESLTRLKGVNGTPELYGADDAQFTLKMSRLPGVSAETLTPANIQALAKIVKDTLAAGVARHSMPIRDIVVDKEGQLGLVDFERVTLRKWSWRPDWIVACWVSYYHLARLIAEYQPQMLTRKQEKLVRFGAHSRSLVRFIHSL
ncbi:protein kinase family protein [Vibrio nitrifigilis]|uniref:Uncharacterized protein n=1 Tax=Vibrio nitrifigilis TaxID=2789781 RepID=A0ABS0GK92_9VIBR|nr:hypothetical protein [Vibrio nitrifigilis]MBF9002894.1 hypothetical protein [Vibrio nitrifigilis]